MPLHWMRSRHLLNAPPMLGPRRKKIYTPGSTPWIMGLLGGYAEPWSTYYGGSINGRRMPVSGDDVLAWWAGEVPGMGVRHCQLVVLPHYGYTASAYGHGDLYSDSYNLLDWSCSSDYGGRASVVRNSILNLPEEMRQDATRFISSELTRRFGDATW